MRRKDYINDINVKGNYSYNEYENQHQINMSIGVGSSYGRNKPKKPFSKILRSSLLKVLLAFVVLYFVFLFVEASVTGDSIVSVYDSLTAKVSDSTVNFDKRLSFVKTDADGKVSIEFGWKDEYTKSTGEVASAWSENNPGVSNPSGSLSGGSTGVDLTTGLKQDPLAFYDKCTLSVGSEVSGRTVGGVPLYDSVPWDSSNAYTLNMDKCRDYVSQLLNANTKTSVVTDNNCHATPTVDGVKCASFAGYPILSFLQIDDYGNAVGWSSSTRPKKCCAVLADASGTLYYLPVSSQSGDGFDAKGHAWPGGVMQTFLSFGGSSSGWNFNTDGGTITGDIMNVTITDLADITKGYSTVKYCGGLVTKTSPQLNLEVHSNTKKDIDNVYTFITFIAWKE